MKLKTLLWIGAALVTVPFASGCGYDCSAVGCPSELQIRLEPEVFASYDVRLVLDSERASFTCAFDETDGSWATRTAAGVRVEHCDGRGFELDEGPASVEISVEAQDGSFVGFTSEAPSYETYNTDADPRCGSCRVADVTVIITP